MHRESDRFRLRFRATRETREREILFYLLVLVNLSSSLLPDDIQALSRALLQHANFSMGTRPYGGLS